MQEKKEQLGDDYLLDLVVKAGHDLDLLASLSDISEKDRLSYLKKIGWGKLRGYIHSAEDIDSFFKKMPEDTHPFLKQVLFLYDTSTTPNVDGPSITPKSGDSCGIIQLDNFKMKFQGTCDVRPLPSENSPRLHIASHRQDYPHKRVLKQRTYGDDYKVVAVVDPEQAIFIANKRWTNNYVEFMEGDFKLHSMRESVAPWNPEFHDESHNDMIPLTHGKWMILTQEGNSTINTKKGWSIYILNSYAFTIKRVFSATKNEYSYVNQLVLLPDKKTVLAWDGKSSVIADGGSCCHHSYQVCLINIEDFSAQLITLPIKPSQQPGILTQVTTKGTEIEFEITTSGYFEYRDYYSFSCSLFADKTLAQDKKQDKSVSENPSCFFYAEESAGTASEDLGISNPDFSKT